METKTLKISLLGLAGILSGNAHAYIVKKGDYLNKIFLENYGEIISITNPKLYQDFLTLNPHLTNPDLIEVGSTLNLPEVIAEKFSYEDYEIKENESVSLIFLKNKDKFPGETVKSFLSKVSVINPHIKNLSLVRPGEKLNLSFSNLYGPFPKEIKIQPPRVEKVVNEDNRIYRIKKGDVLSRVVARAYPSEPYQKMMPLVLKYNPHLKDTHLIEIGDEVKLPTKRALENYLGKDRAVAAVSSGSISTKLSLPRVGLDLEIYNLTNAEAKNYAQLFRDLLESEENEPYLENLRLVLSLSRALGHQHIEFAFLDLLTSRLKKGNHPEHLEELKIFFRLWRDKRIEKRGTEIERT